ncbi:MAG: hypothetical protein R3E82_01480 [Pseudomonadales bacterium]|nr:hypothetical protein [Pseudomonadales bacterium]
MRFAPKLTARILLAAALSATAISAAEARSPDNLSNKVTSIPAQTTEHRHERQSDATTRPQNATLKTGVTSKAQDLAVFALIGLGIIGLLWIRRHTSEL